MQNSTIPEKHRQELRDGIKKYIGNLIFRRVGIVNAHPHDIASVRYYTDDNSFKEISVKDYSPENFTEEELENNISVEYTRFSVRTRQNIMRENDQFEGFGILCHSDRYSEFDIVDRASWRFDRSLNKKRLAAPKVGALVCMLVDRRTKKALHWFSCSEQFLRAWTLLMYEKHNSFFDKSIERTKITSGNYVITNNHKKWVVSRRQNDEEIDEEERLKRFHYLNTETHSIKYMHLYPCLALLSKYGELPTVNNIPNNNGEHEYKCLSWDLPEYFVSTLLQIFTSYRTNWSNLEKACFEKLPKQKPVQIPKERKEFNLNEESFPKLGETKSIDSEFPIWWTTEFSDWASEEEMTFYPQFHDAKKIDL